MTWQERLNNHALEALKAPFVESLVLTAAASKSSVEATWAMWRAYERMYEAWDQSATFPEFVSYHKLKGRGPLA